MEKRLILLLLLSSSFIISFSQTTPFSVSLDPVHIDELGGIQAYAFGQHNGKILIVGGRLDGLHRRQPFASFDLAGHNNQLIVIDPQSKEKWSAPLYLLPTGIKEQLSSTNMEFIQEGFYLYCLGGYGYSPSQGTHTTYDKLTAIDLPNVIEAIISGSDFNAFFRQITDTTFQVTGGRLSRIDGDYYLLGGQKFLGRYNPMGPNHGPGFIQEYKNAIRVFSLTDDGQTITITHLDSHQDEANLHRRDYNAAPQILPDQSQGITLFSGVFRPDVDLPFLNSVTINADGYVVNDTFQQRYNNYHCPVLPLYSVADKEMHTIFFGGIAQFYEKEGMLIEDTNVPFVNTIARVTRYPNGSMEEVKLPVEMPNLLGAAAEFIPNLNLPHFDNEVFLLDSLEADTTLMGYIFGGISSSGPNIFFINDGTQSAANNQLFEVNLIKNVTTAVQEPLKTNALNLIVYPNPSSGQLNIEFSLSKQEDVTISIFGLGGKLISQTHLGNSPKGRNYFQKPIEKMKKNSTYLIVVESPSGRATKKLILEE